MKNQDLRDSLAALDRNAPVLYMGREVVCAVQQGAGKDAVILLSLKDDEKPTQKPQTTK